MLAEPAGTINTGGAGKEFESGLNIYSTQSTKRSLNPSRDYPESIL
jgi:hypothetical protein